MQFVAKTNTHNFF